MTRLSGNHFGICYIIQLEKVRHLQKHHAKNSVDTTTRTSSLPRDSPSPMLVSRAWETPDVHTNTTGFGALSDQHGSSIHATGGSYVKGKCTETGTLEEENLSLTPYIPNIVFNEFLQLFGSGLLPHNEGTIFFNPSEIMKYSTAI